MVRMMEKQSLAFLAVSTALAVLAISLTAVVLSENRLMQNENITTTGEDVLTVTGYAQVTVTPDQLTILFTVEERAPTPAEALARLTTASQNVVSTLLKQGLKPEEVKTVGLNIYPEYVYREGQPPQIVGYIASYTIEAKTGKIGEAGSLIEAAVNAGADYVSGLYFSLSTERQREVYRQLLSAAVSDAEIKANAILTPLGLKTVRVKSVSVSESMPTPVARAAPVQSEAGGPPIMPGTATVSVSVNIVYAIGPR
ncbi:MAG: SIMPL domain-containing protein [Candidatus Caldarchaeum sp.]